ncbi:MAG TPA: permease, partial [Actinomycetota bacterium]
MERARAEPIGGVWVMVVMVGVIAVFGPSIRALVSGPVAQTWVTILLSVTVQAVPFLVLGVVLSSALAAFVPPYALARLVPQRSWLAVPAASVAGVALPGCECSSVVVAGHLVASGVPPGAAVAFLIAGPALNPVVVVATAVAFPGQPRMVAARFLASLVTAVVVGS